MKPESKPKLLFICTTNIIRGAEIVLKDYLSNHPCLPQMMLITNDDPDIQAFFSQIGLGRVIGSRFFSCPGGSKSFLGALKKFYYLNKGILLLRQLIKQEQFTCVVGNNTGDILFAWVKRVLPKTKRPPYVQFIHDLIDAPAFQRVVKLGRSEVDQFVAVSEAAKRSLIKNKVPSQKIKVVYHGAQMQDFNQKKYSNHALRMGYVGALSQEKSPLSIIDLSRNLENALESFSIVCKMERSALYTEVYAKVHFLFVPSLRESFSMVTLEALSCGVPVIARAVGGIPEMIKDGVNGFLFEQDVELQAIATKIREMDQFEYDQLCQNAYQSAQKFSPEQKRLALDKILFPLF